MTSKKIFIIEDAAFVSALLEAQLNEIDDCQVVGVASNGQEGLEKALEIKPDLIFLDLALPGKSGLEVAQELSAGLPEVKIVIISSLDGDYVEEEILKAGYLAFMKKPFTREKIQEVVKSAQ